MAKDTPATTKASDIRKEWLVKELNKAYNRAKIGKSSKAEVIAFTKIAKAEISALAHEIDTRSYAPRPSTAFIVNKPVKREIFAANFRDRVVHHFLFNQVNSWWDARFIDDNYSCRVGKGTLYGIRRLDHHIRSVSLSYTRPAYVLKLEVMEVSVSRLLSGSAMHSTSLSLTQPSIVFCTIFTLLLSLVAQAPE